MRDQLVFGLRNGVIIQRLFTEKATTSTFQKAYGIAINIETAAKDATLVESRESEVQSVHQLRSRHKPSKRHSSPSTNRVPRGPSASTSKQEDRTPCEHCGRRNHSSVQCFHRNSVCSKCKKRGHLRYVCPRNKNKTGPITERSHFVDVESSEYESDDQTFFNLIFNSKNSDKPITLNVKIDNVNLKMEVDTGSAISVINSVVLKELFPNKKVQNTQLKLKAYTGDFIIPNGYIKVNASYNGISKMLKLYVVDNGGPPLLGRSWCRELEIPILCSSINAITAIDIRNKLVQEFPNVFAEGLGTLKHLKAKLLLKENTVPVFRKSRPLPFALKEKVNAELDRLVSEGILTPVAYSDWATPIVPVKKKTDQFRDQFGYLIEELFSKLSGGKKFSKVDLSQAYAQVQLDDESKKCCTINTHRGLFEYNRMPYGIASAPSIFQNIMENIFNGIEGVCVFLDDILITGPSDNEHFSRLRVVLGKLNSLGLKIKANRCDFFENSVSYLGHIVDAEGLPTRFEREDPRDSDSPWNWSDECDNSFEIIKRVLGSTKVLTHFNPPVTDNVIVRCHQIDKEAVGIIFGIKKFHQYLFGQKVTIITDHRPLVSIFGTKKGIPQMAASRLQRWAIMLSAYDFNIEFVHSKNNAIADALTRLPEGQTPNDKPDLGQIFYVEEGFTMFGWPQVIDSEEIKPYFTRRAEIHNDHGCLLWGYRIIIPKILQPQILKELHSSHFGINKCKSLARSYVWWPTVDLDIENVCKICEPCNSVRPLPQRTKLHVWEWPQNPWERVHIDFLGPFRDPKYLVIIDAHTKWLEVIQMNVTTAEKIIEALRPLFARFELPKVVVTDGGPPFTSLLMKLKIIFVVTEFYTF
ncbi:uncharacterized protein K02A2.6-like [Photinus pyralis]|uniref:uncharacterized protein K02A2.6-like n=1 Tax=Photinus pyralis TaxID=7054 RepID=UPI0012671F55|nr:uncharacterized protein K02A2.6-like [Photinus pyralis]